MNIITYNKTFAIVLLGALFLLPILALAQSASFETSIAIEASPASPAPGQEVRVQIRSVSTDLNRAPIVWFVDGAEVARGAGKTDIVATAGALGSRTRVTAVIQTLAGTISKSVVLAPAYIDLLWEAPVSYTPPFYKGKALPASGTLIRVVALPTFVTTGGDALNANNVVYKWKRNRSYRDFNEASGPGENVIQFVLDFLRPNEFVEVEAASFGKSITAQGGVVFEPFDPSIRFYNNHPLRGVQYERALGDELLLANQSEITLRAEPYFFDARGGSVGALSYEWKVNGRAPEDTGSESPNEIVLRTSGGEGKADIALSVEHEGHLFQSARAVLEVVFGQQPTGGFFGF